MPNFTVIVEARRVYRVEIEADDLDAALHLAEAGEGQDCGSGDTQIVALEALDDVLGRTLWSREPAAR